MTPKLFALLYETLRKFFDRQDVSDELGHFYFGKDTVLFFARAVEHTYNTMKYASELEDKDGEE